MAERPGGAGRREIARKSVLREIRLQMTGYQSNERSLYIGWPIDLPVKPADLQASEQEYVAVQLLSGKITGRKLGSAASAAVVENDEDDTE